MYVKFNDLNKQWELIKQNVYLKLQNLFQKSSYINGEDVVFFENNFSKYIGTDYCAGVSNGTDAIKLCIRALNIQSKTKNDLILIPANTFIATALGAKHGNPYATIKLIDCDEYYQINIELLEQAPQQNRLKYDKCIILGVHLFGHCCDVKSILELCQRYDCVFIEDSAQAHGTISNLGKTGSIGELSAFSFYPGKNLGACGDAGGITTNNVDLINIIKSLRNLGTGKDKYHYEYEGYNHRLDTIQAIILNEKLKFLDNWNDTRIKISKIYDNMLSDKVIKPKVAEYCYKHTYHLYVIRVDNRQNLINYLQTHNIETGVHYPICIEQTGIFHSDVVNQRTIDYANTMLSLPIHPFMSEVDAIYIANKVNEYAD